MPIPRRAKTRTARDASPADRPLRLASSTDIEKKFAAALSGRDGVWGAHCIHEQWMRGAFAVDIERALARLWKVAAATIPDWLPMRHIDCLPLVYEVCARFRATGRGRSNLYLVLLDYRDSRAQAYGVYVGMSRYSPAERFDQHKNGIRAAGSVLKRGLEVLTGPTLHLQAIRRAQAEQFEAELAEALREAGLFVQGGH